MLIAIGILIGLIVGGAAVIASARFTERSRLGQARRLRHQIVDDAKREAETIRRESEIDVRESLSLLIGPLGQPETENLPFEFVKANYDALLKRLPTGGGFDVQPGVPESCHPHDLSRVRWSDLLPGEMVPSAVRVRCARRRHTLRTAALAIEREGATT